MFVQLMKLACNGQVHTFLEVCNAICFPVCIEKTFWATTRLVFLGFLIDMVAQTVSVPEAKITKSLTLIESIVQVKSCKVTVKKLQRLCGILNFIGRCIVPGHAFTRCLYTYTSGNKLKHYHHIHVNAEMKIDLDLWSTFLEHPAAFCITHNTSVQTE